MIVVTKDVTKRFGDVVALDKARCGRTPFTGCSVATGPARRR
jgi:hypothetical protein